MERSPIVKLAPELLQKVFEVIVQDPTASLTNSIRVCKKWRPIAQPILYKDVFLNPERLVKFLDNSADEPIHSLTILMDTIANNPYQPSEAAQTAKARLESLHRLLPRIQKMSSALSSFSITVHFPGPLLPTHEIGSLLAILPESCTSLEVDVRQTGFIMYQSPNHPPTHLCDSIRNILPQLVHLRLRLPAICPAVFGVESQEEDDNYQAVSAPKLQSCIVNLAGREPGPTSSDAMATRCIDNYSQTSQVGSTARFRSSLPPLVPSLKAFARLNSNLQRFWVIDVQPQDPTQPHQWAAFVRRDVIGDVSFPVPVANIGSLFSDEWLARVPKQQSRVEDWIVPLALLERIAEDAAWSETATGVRLATPTLRGSEIVPKGRIRPQSEEVNGGTHILWRNEKMAGERMLPEGPGPFMQNWDMNERTPHGWTRENFTGSSLVKV